MTMANGLTAKFSEVAKRTPQGARFTPERRIKLFTRIHELGNVTATELVSTLGKEGFLSATGEKLKISTVGAYRQRARKMFGTAAKTRKSKRRSVRVSAPKTRSVITIAAILDDDGLTDSQKVKLIKALIPAR